MHIRRPNDLPSSDITPESVYRTRRDFIRETVGLTALGLGAGSLLAGAEPVAASTTLLPQKDWSKVRTERDEPLNSLEDVTTYNNFYEFGTGKDDPHRNARDFQPRPWTIEVDGLCRNRGTYGLEDFVGESRMEDRIYRMRCVEAWSMVIPWRGFPLAEVIDRADPLGSAAFVQFETLYDPTRMPGQRVGVLDWPYVEGLRLDEARHPLTILATGVYGTDLPNQNGAPLRLVIPWKYGFKGIKSIVRMTFTEKMPLNSWQMANSGEYGFFANVNPEVDHPRWSQARERRLGKLRRIRTLPFNGYGDQVASMYAGMDLTRWF
jgi:methionine sulfoxide reductase catalytic subunit